MQNPWIGHFLAVLFDIFHLFQGTQEDWVSCPAFWARQDQGAAPGTSIQRCPCSSPASLFLCHTIYKKEGEPQPGRRLPLTYLTWGYWKWLYVKFLTSRLKVFGIFLEMHTSFSTQLCPFQTFFFPWKASTLYLAGGENFPYINNSQCFLRASNSTSCEKWLEMKPLNQSLWGEGPSELCFGKTSRWLSFLPKFENHCLVSYLQLKLDYLYSPGFTPDKSKRAFKM